MFCGVEKKNPQRNITPVSYGKRGTAAVRQIVSPRETCNKWSGLDTGNSLKSAIYSRQMQKLPAGDIVPNHNKSLISRIIHFE